MPNGFPNPNIHSCYYFKDVHRKYSENAKLIIQNYVSYNNIEICESPPEQVINITQKKPIAEWFKAVEKQNHARGSTFTQFILAENLFFITELSPVAAKIVHSFKKYSHRL